MADTAKNGKLEFIWRITAAHTIAYFLAGILALLFMNYEEQFSSPVMSMIMRPIDSPVVSLGAGLQVIRGLIIALVLLPFRDLLIARNGWAKLMALILGLSYISTIGPTFGSFEGYVYTTVALQYHVLGIPEALLYVSLFTSMVLAWYKKPGKTLTVLSIILVVLIVFMSILGAL